MATQDDSSIKPIWSSCKYTALIRPLDAMHALAVLAWLIHYLFPFSFVLRGQVFQSVPVIRYPYRGTDEFPHPLAFVHASFS